MTIQEPVRRIFKIVDKDVEIVSYTSATNEHGDIPIRENTRLSVLLQAPATYDDVMLLAAATDIFFAFMIGLRLESAVHFLPAQRAGQEADDEEVVAEAWPVPAWKRARHAPHVFQRMFLEGNSPVEVDRLLDFALRGGQDIIYFMDIILCAESNDLKLDDAFIEILGCLEDFDQTQFGSGSDPTITAAKRRLRKIIIDHASADDLAACDRIGNGFQNKFSLRQRLERLLKYWLDDGFRGNPDAKRIAEIRNMKPHGRGRELSPAVFREIQIYMPFLKALARYHILRFLGFDRTSIGKSFARKAHRYGMFVPVDLRPSDDISPEMSS